MLQRDIVDILISDKQMVHNRRRFYEFLNPLDPDFELLNTQLMTTSIRLDEFCTKSLGKWVTQNGSGATVEKLREIMELNGFQSIADKIGSSIPTSCTSSAKSFFQINCPTRTFVGRIKELVHLNELFMNPLTVFVKLIGMGGVGKSELAKFFAFSKRDHINGIWLDGESTQSLRASVTILANELRVPLTTNNQPIDSMEVFSDLISTITTKNQLKLIIVIDNVDKDNEDVQKLVQITHRKFKSKCFPLITSRYVGAVHFGGGHVISLDVLETEDAYTLIANSLKDEDALHISTLCQVLHNFPLALQQAIAYVKQQKFTSLIGQKYNIRNYLDAYQDKPVNLLDFPLSKYEHEYTKTTLVTWTSSVDQIKNTETTGPLAIQFLNLIAYFEADGITIDFISRIHANDNKPEELHTTTVTDALILLKFFSLIKSQENVISVHRLLQQVLRVNLESSKLEVEILTKCLESIDNIYDTLTPTDMPHVLSVWKYSTKNKDLVFEFPNLSCKIANKLIKLSLYRELRDFASQSYQKLNSIFGDKHIETLKMEHHIAESLRLNGKYSDALQKSEIVLQKMKSYLGEEHELTLTTTYSMANTLYNLKRHDKAMELYKSVLKSEKRLVGGFRSSRMSTKHQIATVLSGQSKHEEAMKIYQEVLDWRIAKLGDEHPHTLITKHNIAACLYNQGEYEKAKTLLQQVLLEMKVKVLGEEHSDTLVCKETLGWTRDALGETEIGLRMLKEVLISREKVLGAEHPHTIIARNNIDLIIKDTEPTNH